MREATNLIERKKKIGEREKRRREEKQAGNKPICNWKRKKWTEKKENTCTFNHQHLPDRHTGKLKKKKNDKQTHETSKKRKKGRN